MAVALKRLTEVNHLGDDMLKLMNISRKASFPYIVMLPVCFLYGAIIVHKTPASGHQDIIDQVYEAEVARTPVSGPMIKSATSRLPLFRKAATTGVSRWDNIVPQEYTCLTQAIYFEARSEPLEGQLAVAQVVLNRVDSRRYPDSICGVVFQNEHWRNRCQFSFACDGLSDNAKNPVAWARALDIAAMALKNSYDDLTMKSTHYHATYVAPYWSGILKPTVTLGRHVFYRES